MGNRTKKVVVVGGGITGLSTAYYLHKQAKEAGLSIEIQLLEKDDRFGGKIQTFRQNGYTMEGGPDSYLARKVAATNLIKELGLGDQLVGQNSAAKKTYILHRNRLHRIPGGMVLGIPTEIKPFATSTLLTPLGKLRAGMDLFIPKRNEDTDESLGGFLRRRFGDPLVNNIVEPLLSGIYAGDADQLSLKATFPQFMEMESRYRSLIRGVMAGRKVAATQASTIKATQSTTIAASGLNSTGAQSSQPTSMFLSLRNGLESLIEALVERLEQEGVQLRSSRSASTIRYVEGEDYRYEIHLDGEEVLNADAVVVTTPAFAAAELLSGLVPIKALDQIPYASVATVILGYDQSKMNRALDGTGFVVPRKENRTITACTWVSSKWLHTAPDDKALIRCYVGRYGDTRHQKWSDEEIITRVRKDVYETMGLETEPTFTKVVRWDDSMPQYLVGHVERLQEMEQALSERHPGVIFTGAGYYGLGVPDCIVHGQKAAVGIIKHLKPWQKS
jgi:oxygen-dependent protoporphyrinogen oxidase